MDDPRLPRQTSARALSLSGGLILAVCLFLPAVKGCGDEPVYPYEVPMLAEPYLLGLLAAVGALALLVSAPGPARVGAWALAGGAAATFAAAWVGLVLGLVSADDDNWMAGAALIAWTPLGALLWPALRRGPAPAWRLARATWVTGLMCSLWFGLWMIDPDESLYGIYVSMAASLLLLAGGAGHERALRPLPPPGLPRAVAVSAPD